MPDTQGKKQHALKGQKLLAQGNALGKYADTTTPCKGKSFSYSKLLPLQGDFVEMGLTQSVALG